MVSSQNPLCDRLLKDDESTRKKLAAVHREVLIHLVNFT